MDTSINPMSFDVDVDIASSPDAPMTVTVDPAPKSSAYQSRAGDQAPSVSTSPPSVETEILFLASITFFSSPGGNRPPSNRPPTGAGRNASGKRAYRE